MRWRINPRILGMGMLSLLCLVVLSPSVTIAQVEQDDLTDVDVAVYNGLGVMGSSRIALLRLFEWMGATVGNITASEIIAGGLDEYDILAVPGGSETMLDNELESEGEQIVKDYVASGGSYFGICGGATYGVRYLHLFDGFMGPVGEPGDLIHMSTMYYNQSSIGPDLSDFPQNFSTMYYSSQQFTPNPYVETSIHTVARYEYNGEAGMVAFEYENGSVFLSSPHPEFEEDSDRDGTTFGDDLEDPDSEWDLLHRVSSWLIEASYVEPSSLTTGTSTTTTPTTTTTTEATTTTLDLRLIAIVSTGGAIVVFAAVFLYRRM